MALFQSRGGQALDHTPLCSQAHLGAEETEVPPKQNFPVELSGQSPPNLWMRVGGDVRRERTLRCKS